MSDAATTPFSNDELVVRGGNFAMVPEWVLYHPDLSDGSVRLYAIISRFGHTKSWPSRQRLATSLHISVDTIDRHIKLLKCVGALTVEAHIVNNAHSSNIYTLHWDNPIKMGSREDAAGVAARMRPGWPQGCGPKESN